MKCHAGGELGVHAGGGHAEMMLAARVVASELRERSAELSWSPSGAGAGASATQGVPQGLLGELGTQRRRLRSIGERNKPPAVRLRHASGVVATRGRWERVRRRVGAQLARIAGARRKSRRVRNGLFGAAFERGHLLHNR